MLLARPIVNGMHALGRSGPTLMVSDVRCGEECANDARCGYRVAWSLNLHTRVGAADPQRAMAQHRSFVATLEAAGARVLRLPFVHGAYDSVFSKDNAVLLLRGNERRALLGRPRHAERLVEQTLRREALECHGFHVVEPPANRLEGGDVVVTPGVETAFLGFGERSSRAAAEPLARFLESPVVALELVDPRFFHLDLALTVLNDGTALACPQAFASPRAALDAIAKSDGVTNVVPVPLDEALSFALNLVDVGEWVIAPSESATVRRAVERDGRKLSICALDEFVAAGGGAACLVAPVHGTSMRSPTTAMRSTSA
jgi:N-dimethylarginine dimethylaminohydrolase